MPAGTRTSSAFEQVPPDAETRNSSAAIAFGPEHDVDCHWATRRAASRVPGRRADGDRCAAVEATAPRCRDSQFGRTRRRSSSRPADQVTSVCSPGPNVSRVSGRVTGPRLAFEPFEVAPASRNSCNSGQHCERAQGERPPPHWLGVDEVHAMAVRVGCTFREGLLHFRAGAIRR